MDEQQLIHEHDGARKSYGWGDIPLSVKIMICLVSSVLILMFDALLQLGNTNAVTDFVFILLANCLTGLGFLFVHHWTKSIWLSAACAMCLGLVCITFWGIHFGLSVPLIMSLILLIIVVHRIYTLMVSEWIVRQHMTAWRQDMVVGLIFIVFSIVLRLPNLSAPQAMGPVLFICVALILFGRMWIAWKLERLDSRNPRANGLVLFLSLVLAAAIGALVAPSIVERVFDGLIAVMMWGAQWVAKPIAALIAWIRSKERPVPHKLTPVSTQAKPMPVLRNGHIALLQSPRAHTLVTVISISLIVLCIVALVVYLALKGKQERQRLVNDLEPTTERSWIHKKHTLQFMATNHVQRLRYQAWLRKQYDQGQSMQIAETPRQFAARVEGQTVVIDGQAINKIKLTKEYEQARYGESQSGTSQKDI